MKAFFKQLSAQFKMDVRDRGTLINFYIVPLLFYCIFGGVLSKVNPQFKESLISSLIVFAGTMGALMGVSAPLAKLRENGVLRSYRVFGIPSGAVLLAQAVSTFLHIFIVSLLILFTAPALFDATMPQNLPAFVGILAVFLLVSISVGILFGVVAKPQTANMLSIAVFVLSVMLSGMMFPASMLPKGLLYFGRILPATHAMQAFSGLAYGLNTDYNALLALLVLAGTGVVLAVIGTLQFAAVNRESV